MGGGEGGGRGGHPAKDLRKSNRWETRNTPSSYMLLKLEISVGLMGHLSHIQSQYTLFFSIRIYFIRILRLKFAIF